MDSLAYIAPWVMGSVCIGILVGSMLSRGRGKGREAELAERERQATLNVLVDLLAAIDQMSGDVETHDTEIRQTCQNVGRMQVSGEMEVVRDVLLQQMVSLQASNKRLQSDLVNTRYCMEDQAQEIDHARREARTDALTGVANRKGFDEKLHVLLSAFKRERQTFALILMDLDHFKRINDSHGHQAGDEVLQKVGGWLKQWVREGDVVARYGGDEFAVLLPHTDLATGLSIAETIRRKTAEQASRLAVRGELISLSLSIGVASPSAEDNFESLLHRADQGLFRSKDLGRNQVRCEEVPLTYGQTEASPAAVGPAPRELIAISGTSVRLGRRNLPPGR